MGPQRQGSTRPILDLDLRHQTRTFGDITAIWTWNLHTYRPCLALVPTFKRPDGTRVTPCVVSLDSAFLWAPETGDPSITVPLSAQFADALAFSRADPGLLMRIHGIVEDCLPDLLIMRSLDPKADGHAAADVIATDTQTGKTLHEGTLHDV